MLQKHCSEQVYFKKRALAFTYSGWVVGGCYSLRAYRLPDRRLEDLCKFNSFNNPMSIIYYLTVIFQKAEILIQCKKLSQGIYIAELRRKSIHWKVVKDHSNYRKIERSWKCRSASCHTNLSFFTFKMKIQIILLIVNYHKIK